jgi:hypothetical protein
MSNNYVPNGPEYIRLPKPKTRCPITGLSRGTLRELTVPTKRNGFRPPVKSVLIKSRYATRGIRIIPRQQLLGYGGFR